MMARGPDAVSRPMLGALFLGTSLVAAATFVWSERGAPIVLDLAGAGISAFCL